MSFLGRLFNLRMSEDDWRDKWQNNKCDFCDTITKCRP